MTRINGQTSVDRRKRGVALIPNSSLMRFLVFSVAFSVLSMPLVLHVSLTGDCTTDTKQTVSSVSISDVPPRIRGVAEESKKQRSNGEDTSLYGAVQYTLERPPRNSPYTIIHTISTRFMIGQPSRYILARARYLLFETFCWPTMRHQTNHNFYWLILVDPGLDKRILKDMQELLQQMPFQNAFMIMTNNTEWAADGVGVENVTSYGVGLRTIAQEHERGTADVVTGNTTHLIHALDVMDGRLENGKPILSIETLLDADDGLNNQGVDWIQNIALKRVEEQQRYFGSFRFVLDFQQHTNLQETWWFLCGTDHIEWHNRDIFRIAPEDYAVTGITSGLTGVRKAPYFCTSAGFTRIGLTTAPSNMTFPKDGYSNHALAFYFPECTAESKISTTPTVNVSMAQCWRREFPGQPFILKSRSITSDSMDNLHPKDHDYRDVPWVTAEEHPLLINETEKSWEILVQNFSINRRAAWSTSVYQYEHRRQILRENKVSRCSPGFPCYKAAKKNMILMERYWMRQASNSSRITAFQELMSLQKEERQKGFLHQYLAQYNVTNMIVDTNTSQKGMKDATDRYLALRQYKGADDGKLQQSKEARKDQLMQKFTQRQQINAGKREVVVL